MRENDFREVIDKSKLYNLHSLILYEKFKSHASMMIIYLKSDNITVLNIFHTRSTSISYSVLNNNKLKNYNNKIERKYFY